MLVRNLDPSTSSQDQRHRQRRSGQPPAKNPMPFFLGPKELLLPKDRNPLRSCNGRFQWFVGGSGTRPVLCHDPNADRMICHYHQCVGCPSSCMFSNMSQCSRARKRASKIRSEHKDGLIYRRGHMRACVPHALNNGPVEDTSSQPSHQQQVCEYGQNKGML